MRWFQNKSLERDFLDYPTSVLSQSMGCTALFKTKKVLCFQRAIPDWGFYNHYFNILKESSDLQPALFTNQFILFILLSVFTLRFLASVFSHQGWHLCSADLHKSRAIYILKNIHQFNEAQKLVTNAIFGLSERIWSSQSSWFWMLSSFVFVHNQETSPAPKEIRTLNVIMGL